MTQTNFTNRATAVAKIKDRVREKEREEGERMREEVRRIEQRDPEEGDGNPVLVLAGDE